MLTRTVQLFRTTSTESSSPSQKAGSTGIWINVGALYVCDTLKKFNLKSHKITSKGMIDKKKKRKIR